MLKVILAVLLVLVVILGWKILRSNNQPNQSPQVTKVTESPQEHVIVSRTVDSRGADIAVGHIAPSINGLVIHIPPGALEQVDSITLGYSMRSVPIDAGKASGIVVALRADTVTQFLKPVSIELHYRELPLPSMAIPYSIDAKGRLHGMQLVKVDERNSTIVFDTFQPVDFTWVYP